MCRFQAHTNQTLTANSKRIGYKLFLTLRGAIQILQKPVLLPVVLA